MKNLYIYAYPAQMITFQLVDDKEPLTNENCAYEDIVQTTIKYLNKEAIDTISVIGNTSFADKIVAMLKNTFGHRINVGRINNA